MDNSPTLTIAQRLAHETQLLREEKMVVNALKVIREERYALQREGMEMLRRLKEVLNEGVDPRNVPSQEGEGSERSGAAATPTDAVPSTNRPTSPMPEVTNLTCLDDVLCNEVELNLTVPTHYIFDPQPEEELEEIELEDDFEIEMAMLMQGYSMDNEH